MWRRPGKASPQERQLVLDCVRGDTTAWDQLVEMFQGPIFRFAHHLLGPEEAEDATQEVFLRTFRALHTFRGDSRLSTWIYKIAVNLCRDKARYQRRRPIAFSLDDTLLAEEGEVGRQLADESLSVDDCIQTRELNQQVTMALRQLSESHRAVLVLHDMQGLRYEEIAQILRCSLGTVKSRLYYARRKMAKLLQEYIAS